MLKWKLSLKSLSLAIMLAASTTTIVSPVLAQQPPAADAVPRQIADDVFEPIDQEKPDEPKDIKHSQALAHFLAGRSLQLKGDNAAAYDEYKMAIAEEPESLEILEVLVPLAFALQKNDDGLNYAKQLVELNPENIQVLRRIAMLEASQGRIQQAITYYNQALEAKNLDKNSIVFVTLQRELGEFHTILGNHAEASKAFEVLFDAMQNPDRYNLNLNARAALLVNQAQTYERLGQTFVLAKNFDLATQAFKLAVSTSRKNPALLGYFMAMVNAEQGDFETALTELNKYLDAHLNLSGEAPYNLLKRIYTSLGKEGELLPRVEALLNDDSRNRPLNYFVAEQYIEAKRYDDARKILETQLKRRDNQPAYQGLLKIARLQNEPAKYVDYIGDALTSGENTDPLEAELEVAAQEKPFVESVVKEASGRVEASPPKMNFAQAYLVGKLAKEADDIDAVKKFFLFAIAVQPQPNIRLYQELASYLIEKEQYAEGTKLLLDAANRPEFSQQKAALFYLAANALELNHETSRALETIKEAQQIDPDNFEFLFFEGWIHYHARQFDEAITIFNNLLADVEGSNDVETETRITLTLSNVYMMMGRFDESEKVLEEIYLKNPDDTTLNNDLGYLYADRNKNLDKAKEMIQKALNDEPDNGSYLDSMGWVLFRLGEYDEAIKQLEKAVEKRDGGDEVILDHLGDVYEKVGRKDDAIRVWSKALESSEKAGDKADKKLLESLKTKLEKIKQ